MSMNASDLVIPAAMRPMYDRFHFAPAVRAGDLLLCSGQLGLGPDGRAISDPAAQFAAAFDAVKTLLAEAGLSFADLIEITTFHAGGMQHLGTFAQVKDRYLPAPYPAWTAIGVVELAVPGALVEIRAIARRGRPGRGGRERRVRGARQRCLPRTSGEEAGAGEQAPDEEAPGEAERRAPQGAPALIGRASFHPPSGETCPIGSRRSCSA
jgi:enamine deaminase RidA (YjgF/YER057c/UK114 family)